MNLRHDRIEDMARKTRKQKLRTSQKVTKGPENIKTQMQTTTQNKAPSIIVSAEDRAEAQVTKRGILKTLILIALLFVLQTAIFFGKSKGMLPF